MILVDSSVWIAHLREGVAALAAVLDEGMVLTHPLVTGEIACGSLPHRAEVLALLAGIPAATRASDVEALEFIERHSLMGRGVGFIDVHLLASTALTHGASLWTRDRRLAAIAAELDLGLKPDFFLRQPRARYRATDGTRARRREARVSG
jgi:predicted nucleic acid-binding protein